MRPCSDKPSDSILSIGLKENYGSVAQRKAGDETSLVNDSTEKSWISLVRQLLENARHCGKVLPVL